MNSVLRWLVFVGVCVGIVMSFLAPNAETFPVPGLARIVFFHLPCAFLTTVFLVGGAYLSIQSLSKMKIDWDVSAAAAFELAFVLGLITLASGILFSKVQWGAWWHWDPRQTSFLLVMLIIGAYFALRSGFSDEQRRSRVSAAYAVASLLPILFLIFVYPRIPAVKSIHPIVIGGGKDSFFDRGHWTIILINFFFLGCVTYWIYKLRVRAGLLQIELEKTDARLANRDRPASSGVVRAVSVPPEG